MTWAVGPDVCNGLQSLNLQHDDLKGYSWEERAKNEELPVSLHLIKSKIKRWVLMTMTFSSVYASLGNIPTCPHICMVPPELYPFG